MNSHGHGIRSAVLIKFFHFVLKKLFHLKNSQVLWMYPVHTSTHWIYFALFVGESTSHVIVFMHILCDVEYSCQRTCHVNMENGLQIGEMLQCSWFYSRHSNSTQKTCAVSTYNCGSQTLGHRSWNKTDFCELVASGGLCVRNKPTLILFSSATCFQVIRLSEGWVSYVNPQSAITQVKVKCPPEQATKAEKGSRGVALILNLGARCGWAVSGTPWPLYPPGHTRYLFYHYPVLYFVYSVLCLQLGLLGPCFLLIP